MILICISDDNGSDHAFFGKIHKNKLTLSRFPLRKLNSESKDPEAPKKSSVPEVMVYAAGPCPLASKLPARLELEKESPQVLPSLQEKLKSTKTSHVGAYVGFTPGGRGGSKAHSDVKSSFVIV